MYRPGEARMGGYSVLKRKQTKHAPNVACSLQPLSTRLKQGDGYQIGCGRQDDPIGHVHIIDAEL
jgi:hypothetical protein